MPTFASPACNTFEQETGAHSNFELATEDTINPHGMATFGWGRRSHTSNYTTEAAEQETPRECRYSWVRRS